MKKDPITLNDVLDWCTFFFMALSGFSACLAMMLAVYADSMGAHECEQWFWFYAMFGWMVLAAPCILCEAIATSRRDRAYYAARAARGW